jgi:glycosyltransferase involved in cell wall biosynthesis
VQRAINSLISQTEEDWEAIIIDDGSTDDTYTEIQQYIKACNKIRYIRTIHGGGIQSKNEGIAAAKGKFVSFLDSDDEYKPNHLQSRKQILLENRTVKFLHGGTKILGNQYVPDRFDYSKKINLKDCVIGGTFFIERHSLLSLNGFIETPIGEDADLFERAEKAKVVMMETSLPTYIYHHENQDSITNRMMMNLQLL